MADEPETKTTQIHLAEQYAAEDLKANRAQQAELEAELATTPLGQKLAHLKAVEAFLVTRTAQDTPEGAAAVPQPRQQTPAAAAAPVATDDTKAAQPRTAPTRTTTKPAAAKTTTAKAPAKKTAAKKTAAKKTSTKRAPAQKAAAKAEGPSLPELLQALLLATPGEPRTARELVTQFTAEHPKRATSEQTVRNALERGVAKSLIERNKQGSTVLYTADPQQNTASGTGKSTGTDAAPVSTGTPAQG
ncbi:hypothetical protein G3I40_05480 [Streptomyces sp. SID14478]|uniref:hypothetical protein n=1 Tax=Streptomyces sp. SID14478 TaxID=2706073 RepID=UPI0013D961D8|nr:hypothetical protein [Streptomyces sp. SID14478]NEB74684.1 hypothetical protein [Streptomyces sp. SID14478]